MTPVIDKRPIDFDATPELSAAAELMAGYSNYTDTSELSLSIGEKYDIQASTTGITITITIGTIIFSCGSRCD